jgi:HEAT repeat protein
MNDFHTTLNILADTRKPIARRELRGLSDIGREYEDEFYSAWHGIEDQRRRELARVMTELAEESVDFDFRDVFTALLRDVDPEVRLSAVEGLWGDDRPRTMRQLLIMLDRDADNAVRAAVALSLGRFAYQASFDELRADDAAQLRASLLTAARNLDLNADVRRRAVESVGYFNGADVDEVIAGAYATGNNRLKVSALVAIGHSLDPRWLPILQAELGSSEPELCYEAARASGEIGEAAQSLVPLLVPLTSSDDVEIYTAAIWALGQIGGKVSLQALRRIVESGDGERQQAAEEAISEIDLDDGLSGLSRFF